MNALKVDNKEGTMLTLKQASECFNLSVNTLKKLALEAGALVRIGTRITRINAPVLYEYLEKTYTVKSD